MREFEEMRQEVQIELNKARRLKEVSIITGNHEKEKEADIQIEKLVIRIEAIDSKIKEIKEERKAKVEQAKKDLEGILEAKDSIKNKIDQELTPLYVELGGQDILDEIETYMTRLQQLEEMAQARQDIIDGKDLEPKEEVVVEPKEEKNAVDKFIKSQLDDMQSLNQIAMRLNDLAPTPLDEYVASPEYKNMYQLYRDIHFIDRNDEVVLDSYKFINFAKPINLDFSNNYELEECVTRMNEIIEEEKKIQSLEDSEYGQRHYELNDEYKNLEKKCVIIINKAIREAYKLYIGDKILNKRGTDFTEWAYDEKYYFQDSVLDLMFGSFNEKAKKEFLPKDELREVGDLNFITATDLDRYIDKIGLLEPKQENNKLNEMFDGEETKEVDVDTIEVGDDPAKHGK